MQQSAKKKTYTKDTRERLLSAGLELFLKQGYNATGIQQIANSANAPKGSFYNYFNSKETFGAAIIDEYEAVLQRYWKKTLAHAPEAPDEAIRYLFDQMISYHRNNESYRGCLIGNFSAEVSASSELCREHLLTAQHQWRERLADLIEQAQQQGKARTDMDAMALSSIVWNVWTGGLLRMKSEKSVKSLHENISNILTIMLTP